MLSSFIFSFFLSSLFFPVFIFTDLSRIDREIFEQFVLATKSGAAEEQALPLLLIADQHLIAKTCHALQCYLTRAKSNVVQAVYLSLKRRLLAARSENNLEPQLIRGIRKRLRTTERCERGARPSSSRESSPSAPSPVPTEVFSIIGHELAYRGPFGIILVTETEHVVMNSVTQAMLGYTNEEISTVRDWFTRLYHPYHETFLQFYSEEKRNDFSWKRDSSDRVANDSHEGHRMRVAEARTKHRGHKFFQFAGHKLAASVEISTPAGTEHVESLWIVFDVHQQISAAVRAEKALAQTLFTLNSLKEIIITTDRSGKGLNDIFFWSLVLAYLPSFYFMAVAIQSI